MLLFFTGMGGAGAYLYHTQTTPTYQATALIEMNVRPPKILGEGVRLETGRTEEVFNTRLGRLRGSRFSMLLEENFRNMWDRHAPPTPESEKPPPASMSYNMMRQSRLIQIQARADTPIRAAISANAAAESAERFFQQENQDISDAAVEWLNQQAANQKEVLNRADDALLAFQIEHNLDVEQANQQALQSSILLFSNQLIELNSQYIYLKDTLKMLESLDESYDIETALPVLLPNRDLVLDRVRLLHATRAQRSTLLGRFTERHPQIQELDFQLLELEEAIRREIQTARNTFQQQFDVLQSQQESIFNELRRIRELFSRRNRDLMRQHSRLNNLIRERDAAEQMFRNVLTRIEEARLAADEDSTMMKIVERAASPKTPIHPRLMLTLPVGLMGGLALGLLIALVAEAIEDRIFSISELEASISNRIIGIIPHVPNVQRSELGVVCLKETFSQTAESFNAIRVLLDHSRKLPGNHPAREQAASPFGHVVMFCSGLPGEGKTICAANVAITSARAGQKTLLIDGDMRRPRIAKVFESVLKDSSGKLEQASLLHHLTDRNWDQFTDVVIPGPTPNLDLIASQNLKSINPSDLIGDRGFHNLILWARKHYDRIIIDTPPIGIISDGLVIASQSDAVVVVCRAGRTRHRALRHVLMQLKGVNVPFIGIVVNDFKIEQSFEPLDGLYKEFANSYTAATVETL